MSQDKIESIKKIGKEKEMGADIAEGPESMAAQKEHFDSLMLKQNQTQPTAPITQKTDEITAIQKPSLIDEMRDINNKVDHLSRVSPAEIAAQAENTIKQIDTLKQKLAAPDVAIQGSVQTLLHNKLSHIDDNLKIALSKAGVEYKVSPAITGAPTNPIERFLGFLTDGQYQLKNLASELQTMQLKQGELSPASMLAIQIKVGYIQQELEFFTGLLNKALESTKTVMNVQV